MRFWRTHTPAEAATAVAGIIRGESVHLLRGTRVTDGAVRTLGEAIVRREDLPHLGPLLQGRLGWGLSEPVFLAPPTPLLVGESLTVTLARHEEGHPVVRDTRELTHHLQWRASDAVRERTAMYVGCPLTDVEPVGTAVERWREGADGVTATLFHLCTMRPGLDALPPLLNVPRVEPTILPLVLSQEIGAGTRAEALVHVEDDRVVFLVRHAGIRVHVRSLPVGIALVREHVAEAVGCSLWEAEVLLSSWSRGALSVENAQHVDRILRTLLPLWVGVFATLAEDLPEAHRPTAALITGVYPALVTRSICRPRVLARCAVAGARVSVLGGDPTDVLGMSAMLRRVLARSTRPSINRSPGLRIPHGLLVRA